MWTKTSNKTIRLQKKEVLATKVSPNQHLLMRLDLEKFTSVLLNSKTKNTSNEKVIMLPNANGDIQRFLVKETSYLAPELAAKFPQVTSFSAQGIDDTSSTAKISIGKDGVHVMLFTSNESTVYIDPYTKDHKEYVVYKKGELASLEDDFSCKLENTVQKSSSSSLQSRNANDGTLRTFRTAIACTGEYAQYHIERNNLESASDNEKKVAVLSAINTTMTRVNGIFERDLAVRMVLVNNNDELIFLDAETDGLSNDDANFLIDESQVKCDAIIGDANYDIGHTLAQEVED